MSKNNKFLALFLILLVCSILPINFASAGGNSPAFSCGPFKCTSRVDTAGFSATCKNPEGKSGYVPGPHINIEILKGTRKIANIHIGWRDKCLIAWDSQKNVCKQMCYDDKSKGKIGDILKSLGISNSMLKDIQQNKYVLDDLRKINTQTGTTPTVIYSPDLGVYLYAVGAITTLILMVIAIFSLPLSKMSTVLSNLIVINPLNLPTDSTYL